MRAIAIGAVLLAHAGLPFAEGGYVGVDVFFVISGFLITGLLLRELERTGSISLGRFYARRVRRLLPLATLVLAFIVVASQLVLSPVSGNLVARDVLAATVYAVNWRFMSQSVDYFAEDVAVSPVLHYWTLAIEEQFYLVWPALLLIGTLWWRRSGRSVRPAAWLLVVAVGAGSLAYSVAFTEQAAEEAYFSTFARAWELALGAAIAMARLPRLPGPAAAGLGWAGLAAIGVAVVVFDGSTPFPGTAALLPTLGAAALIVAGIGGGAAGPGRILSLPGFRHVGRISYGWYLWHWPLLIFAGELWGPLSISQGVAVVLGAYIPTVVSHRLVEEPIHRSDLFARRPRAAVGLWSAGTGVAAGAAALLLLQSSVPEAPATEVRGAAAPGEARQIQASADALRPRPEEATQDRGPLTADGCFVGEGETRSPGCVYGDRSSDTTVILMGDSHAMHYFPPLEAIARERGWRLVALTKAGCPPTRTVNGAADPKGKDCHEWREAMLDRIESEERPELVVVSGATGYSVREGDRTLEGEARADALERGYVSVLEQFRDAGARVAVVKDPPVPPRDIPECVSESLDRLERCAFELPDGFGETFETRAAAAVDGAQLVDVTPKICRDGKCAAVIGDALVYRNKGHLTATFAATLAPTIARQLPRLP